MDESYKDHQRLALSAAARHLCNFDDHLSQADAERSPLAVYSRKRFYQAGRARVEGDREYAITLYDEAWPHWLMVLAQNPKFAESITTQEDTYETQVKHQILVIRERTDTLRPVFLGMAQLASWPYPPWDSLLLPGQKTKIVSVRNARGLTEWVRYYGGPEKENLQNFLFAWTQSAGFPRPIFFPGQEQWMLTALDYRDNPLHPRWNFLITEDSVRQVRDRMGLAPRPQP